HDAAGSARLTQQGGFRAGRVQGKEEVPLPPFAARMAEGGEDAAERDEQQGQAGGPSHQREQENERRRSDRGPEPPAHIRGRNERHTRQQRGNGGFSVARYGLLHQQPQGRIPATDFTVVRSHALGSWASNRGAALSLTAGFPSADFHTSQGVVPRWYMS